MNRAHKQRGTTLIECVVAMAVLTVGSLGLLALHRNGVRIEADSRHVTRASAIAQDLVNQMESWTYDEAPTSRLSSVTTDNDTKLGDPAFEFETAADPVSSGLADHGEDDLDEGGMDWNGLPAASIPGYERYWSVAYVDDSNGNGVWDSVRIAVIVRWQTGSGWRRVVMMATKPNPAEAR